MPDRRAADGVGHLWSQPEVIGAILMEGSPYLLHGPWSLTEMWKSMFSPRGIFLDSRNLQHLHAWAARSTCQSTGSSTSVQLKFSSCPNALAAAPHALIRVSSGCSSLHVLAYSCSTGSP